MLLRETLAELRRLNANFEKRNAIVPVPPSMDEIGFDENSEELEYFE